MVVGTQCRILYSDAMGRMNLALKFNEMVRNGEIGPVMLGRDHHDTGGTDSPFRETSNIKDGSNIMADMATQCYAGNAARGMSLIALLRPGGPDPEDVYALGRDGGRCPPLLGPQ